MTDSQNHQPEGTAASEALPSASATAPPPSPPLLPESPTRSGKSIEVLHQQGSLLDINLDEEPSTPTINNVSINTNDEHNNYNDISTMSGPIQTVVPPLPSLNRRTRHATADRDEDGEEERQESSESLHEGTSSSNSGSKKKKERWPFWYFIALLLIDLNAAIVLFLPIFPWVYHSQGESNRKEASSFFHFSVDSSIVDLFILSLIRITVSICALGISYYRKQNGDDQDRHEWYPLDLFHPNGTKKTRDELEEESLEQPIIQWLKHQHFTRIAVWTELSCVFTCIWCIIKCLLRMNVEIGLYGDSKPVHPIMWISISFGTLLAVLESIMIDMTCQQVTKWGRERRQQASDTSAEDGSDRGGRNNTAAEASTPTANNTTNATTTSRNPIRMVRRQVSNTLSRVSSSLSIPLLSGADSVDGDDGGGTTTDGEYYETTDDEFDATDDEGSRVSRQTTDDENYVHPLTPPSLLAEMNGGNNNEESASDNSEGNNHDHGVSDIGSESDYKATWNDLLMVCAPDVHLIALAFVFLLLAAAAQVYIPRFTGKILDSLAHAFSNAKNNGCDNNGGYDDDDDNMIIHNGDDDDERRRQSMSDVPGFMKNVKLLIVASIMGGVFSGLRGSIFTVVGGRVLVRLRMRLMDSLLVQEIGFFDTTKTGDLTSRLSSDTQLVGDQVTLNVNVFLRSLVQAIGVLIFMFVVSWQLSILAFISVPAVTILSKWYGHFVRTLTKVMQKKLADGNSVSEAAISSMPTVRAFDAAKTEMKEFESFMKRYLDLNFKAAAAYSGYSACVTSLPQLVTALVVFYGGLMVRNGDITAGDLVSFLLYLQSLSDAFSSIGYIFASLTQAVGAADKVFELMYRKPKFKDQTIAATTSVDLEQRQHQGREGLECSDTDEEMAATEPLLPQQTDRHRGISTELAIGGMDVVSETSRLRCIGLEPENCYGEIVLDNVEMYYPARPQRKVLDQISLRVPPGKIAALVGQSGGGKSSVISLVQHLYDPSAGKVYIDGNEVHELSPRWLGRNISIVSQEPTLFARSLKRNIMYGLEGTDMEPSSEEIERVARLANADAFIQKMPQKYETDVGERGVQLSGGQKQRIAIARALVRKPKILLLDEATSALDAESEHMVQEAIDHMLAEGRGKGGNPGMTVLIVAHRLSTIRNADIIFVVRDGKVVEEGSHAELTKNPEGAYSSLIRRQMDVHKKLEAGTKKKAK